MADELALPYFRMFDRVRVVRYSERLADNDIVASVGSKGDSYDNAMAESFNGLYKWELIYPQGPWQGLDDIESERLYSFITERLAKPGLPEHLSIHDLEPIEELERSMLVERHLISRELASSQRHTGVAVDANESVAIMINEEDHLRIQVFGSGLQPAQIWARMERLDDLLMQRLPMAWSEEFGFLT